MSEETLQKPEHGIVFFVVLANMLIPEPNGRVQASETVLHIGIPKNEQGKPTRYIDKKEMVQMIRQQTGILNADVSIKAVTALNEYQHSMLYPEMHEAAIKNGNKPEPPEGSTPKLTIER